MEPLETQLLTLIGQLGASTPSQLNRPFYSPSSQTRMYEILHSLALRKFITPIEYRHPHQMRGNPNIAYKLSSKGYRTISVDADSLIHGSKVHVTPHFIEANEPIIKALELQRLERTAIKQFLIDYAHFKDQALVPDLEVRFESELNLRKSPLVVSTYTIIPDAFVVLTNRQSSESIATIFEWDKSSISLAKMSDRLYEYIVLDREGAFKERLGVETIRVVWLCETKKRAMQLIEATNRLTAPMDLFAFGVNVDPNPLRFYFDPLYCLASGEMVNLLPNDWRQGWLKSS